MCTVEMDARAARRRARARRVVRARRRFFDERAAKRLTASTSRRRRGGSRPSIRFELRRAVASRYVVARNSSILTPTSW